MPKDELHDCQCDFQPVNGNEILTLSALITCFGKHQTDGVITSHVEGGVLMDSGDEKDENKNLLFYILGYNGYSSDGTLCFSVVADGKTTACVPPYLLSSIDEATIPYQHVYPWTTTQTSVPARDTR